jgi:hypothetical protein
MTITLCLLLFGLAAAHLAPDTHFGKIMRRTLIEAPARWLEGTKPLKLAVRLAVLVAMACAVSGAPELAAVVGLGDLALYFDAAALALLMGAVVTYKSLLAPIATRTRRSMVDCVRGLAARRRRGRALHPRRQKPRAASDADKPEPSWAFA